MQTTREGVYGRSGSGKSTYVKKRIGKFRHVIVYDPMDEYDRLAGFKRCETLADVKKHLAHWWKRRGDFKLAYVPNLADEKGMLNKLSLLLLADQREFVRKNFSGGAYYRPLLLVVEELSRSFPVTAYPQHLTAFPEICTRGRHSAIHVIGVAQRVAEVNNTFRGNCTRQVFFPQGNHTDIVTIAQTISPKWKEAIQNLKTHEYLAYENGSVTRGKNTLSGKKR